MVFGLAVVPLNILLNLLLIPAYQLTGAAFATSLSILFGLVGAGIYVYSKFGVLFDFTSFWKILLSSLVIFAIAMAFPMSGIALLAEYFVLFAVYLFMMYLLKSAITEDVRKVTFVLKRIVQK
jgi:O-antigen/teichoic acid export membrane protein